MFTMKAPSIATNKKNIQTKLYIVSCFVRRKKNGVHLIEQAINLPWFHVLLFSSTSSLRAIKWFDICNRLALIFFPHLLLPSAASELNIWFLMTTERRRKEKSNAIKERVVFKLCRGCICHRVCAENDFHHHFNFRFISFRQSAPPNHIKQCLASSQQWRWHTHAHCELQWKMGEMACGSWKKKSYNFI